MPDEHVQPYDSLSRWLAEDPDDDPSMPTTAGDSDHGPRRRRVRLMALIVPWVVTLAVLAATMGTGGGPAVPQPATGAAARPTAGERSEHSAPDHEMPPPDAVAATAVALVRDAVTGRDGDTARAVDIATAEPPRPLGDHWLVRVHAVVLRGDARRWRSATHEVWAVPVTARGDRAVGLDPPWRVAFERPRITAGDWRAAEVDRDAVAAALRAVAARPAGDLDAQRHPDLPGILRVRTIDAGSRHVWLATEPGLHVLGATDDTTVREDAS